MTENTNNSDDKPPLTTHQLSTTIQKHQRTLSNPKTPISSRMRSLYALRHMQHEQDEKKRDEIDPKEDKEIAEMIASALAPSLEDPSLLLAHEVAYCYGQMRRVEAIPYLNKALANESLASIVRHEAGEALGAIGVNILIAKDSHFHLSPINSLSFSLFSTTHPIFFFFLVVFYFVTKRSS